MKIDEISVRCMEDRRDGDGDDDDYWEKETAEENKTDIVTLDLLGGCGTKELLDRDVQKLPKAGVAECGNEDGYSTCLKSNELECITSILIPSAPDLELRLSLPSTTTGCQSVCTLDKVRFSLERLKKNSQLKAPSSSISSPTSTSTTTTTSTKHEMMMKKKRTRYFTDSSSSEDETVVVHTVISGDESLFCCSLCSSYVFVTEPNSRCPRCESSMPFPMPKKSKIEIVTGDEDILDQEGRLFGGAQFPRE